MAEEYNPDIVSIVDENGEEHIFEELDRIETDDARYVALLPVYDDAEDILEDDGEIILLKVEEEANGDTYLCPIENAKEFDEVQAIPTRCTELFNLAVHINPTILSKGARLRARIADLPAFAGCWERELYGRHPPALNAGYYRPYPAWRGSKTKVI